MNNKTMRCYVCEKTYKLEQSKDKAYEFGRVNPFARRMVLEWCPECISKFTDFYINLKKGG